MQNAHERQANDDGENSIMLACRSNTGNQLATGTGSGDVRWHQAMRLLLCTGGALAVWYVLHRLDRRLAVRACVSAEQLALRDSTSERRSAARWENEGGAMPTGH
ncbi:MAG: hypothetical protein ABI434_23495, partial [Burkholderiaceae bacterium]